MCTLFAPAQSQPIIDRFVLKWQIHNNNKWHSLPCMCVCVCLCEFICHKKKPNQIKKEYQWIKNKIIRFFFTILLTYFCVLFITSYYIIIRRIHTHTTRLLHLVFKKQPKMSLYIIINITSLPSLFYCYVLYYFFTIRLDFFSLYICHVHTCLCINLCHKTISSIQLKTYFWNNIIWIWFFFII